MLRTSRRTRLLRRVTLTGCATILTILAIWALVACTAGEGEEATPPVTVMSVADTATPAPTETATPTAEPTTTRVAEPTEEPDEAYPGPAIQPISSPMPDPYPTPQS